MVIRITQSHKILDSILLSLLVFSGGGLLFVLNRNLFSVLLCVVAVFALLFFGKKKDFFITNPRLSLMIRALEKLSPERKKHIFECANNFINKVTQ